MKKNNFSKSKFFGFLFGFILILSQINIIYGLPLVLLFIVILSKKNHLNKKDRLLFFITILQISWFMMMFVLFPVNFSHWVKNISVFIIILTLIVFKVDFNFIIGFTYSLIILLFFDLAFNLISIFNGIDPFGRVPVNRPDDLFPRLGGIFGHSFFSINISFFGLISAYIKKNKFVLTFSIVNILLAGSLRGIILLILFLIAFIVIKKGISFLKLKTYSFLFAISVFVVTVYSVSLNFSSANLMRVFAWTNSINNISINPVFGKHDFYSDKIETISFETIENYGITESQFLEIAVHYGIFPSILFLIIMTLMLRKSYNAFTNSNESNSQTKIILISTFIIFTDTFYGSLYGTPFTTFYFTILIFSGNKKNIY